MPVVLPLETIRKPRTSTMSRLGILLPHDVKFPPTGKEIDEEVELLMPGLAAPPQLAAPGAQAALEVDIAAVPLELED